MTSTRTNGSRSSTSAFNPAGFDPAGFDPAGFDPTGFDPTGPAFSADPHAMLHRLRELAPVHRRSSTDGRTFWYLTRHADVRRALAEPDLGRQLDRLPADLAALHRRFDVDPLPMVRANMFNLDPPDHTRLRRLIAPWFTARTVLALRPRVQQIVDSLVAGLTTGGAASLDLMAAFARPLPGLVAAELVGFPIDDPAAFRAWSDAIQTGDDLTRIRSAGAEFVAYSLQKVALRRARPDGSLLSELARAEGGTISHAELISSLFQLLFAGDETTVNLIGNGVLELLRHPDQLSRLRDRPELIDAAVEEMLRYNGPVGHSRPLFAMADLTLGGARIRSGEVVVPILLAAGRDPEVFAEPDRFDLGRRPNRHLAFGHGVHLCPGAYLARMQARIAIGTLLRAVPALALACREDELEWTPQLFLHGVRRLPVTVDRSRSPL